jgi:hypothetical protein
VKRQGSSAIFGLLALLLLQSGEALGESTVRFVAVDIYIDSQQPVAAWQFEFTTRVAGTQIVGVENGDSAAFGDAPYYDRNAIAAGTAERVIVADFSLRPLDELPHGRFRVTTLHLIAAGDDVPTFETRLVVATTVDGTQIFPAIRTQISTGSE